MIKSIANRSINSAETLTKGSIVELTDREVASVVGGALAREKVTA